MADRDTRPACDNLNHRRAQVSIRYCPSCGVLLNDRLAVRQCSHAAHVAAMRDRTTFCSDCGGRIIS